MQKIQLKERTMVIISNPLVVYDITVIPKERNAGSFKQLDKYVQKKQLRMNLRFGNPQELKSLNESSPKKEKKLRTI